MSSSRGYSRDFDVITLREPKDIVCQGGGTPHVRSNPYEYEIPNSRRASRPPRIVGGAQNGTRILG